ncbi:hypothetical protein CNR22_07760 [Sphingobacteriaceae bacterium]|nr:hypothetical protein CNR22_07760 [Sphingobacteriaceae bacterium]
MQKAHTCKNCGKEHADWPALTYDSPTAYNVLPQNVKERIGDLESDFCVVSHEEQTDRFIRVVLLQKVIDHCEDLHYGLWVSLSEKSFSDYSDNFHNEDHETEYFGWLSNDLPDYDFEKSIPTTVYTKKGNQRPEIIPHKDFDHPFVHDYYDGITKKEAEKRINDMLNLKASREETSSTKPWWKFW